MPYVNLLSISPSPRFYCIHEHLPTWIHMEAKPIKRVLQLSNTLFAKIQNQNPIPQTDDFHTLRKCAQIFKKWWKVITQVQMRYATSITSSCSSQNWIYLHRSMLRVCVSFEIFIGRLLCRQLQFWAHPFQKFARRM